MSQVVRKLKFEVDAAVIYVFKDFWRKINAPAHLWHCHDLSEFKSRGLSPAMSPLSPTRSARESNVWYTINDKMTRQQKIGIILFSFQENLTCHKSILQKRRFYEMSIPIF